jgi:hypothetical protein
MIFNEKKLKKKKTNSNSSQINNYYYLLSSSTTINNVTEVRSQDETIVNPFKYWEPNDINYNNNLTYSDTIPTFLNQSDLISVPAGVKRAVERLPVRLLRQIDKERSVAIEKCLIIASNCTSAIFYEDTTDKWKNLSSKFLQEQVKKGNDNTLIYKKVINALCYKTNSTAPILDVKTNCYGNPSYLKNEYSIPYKFNDAFQKYNIVNYELKNSDNIQKRRKYFLELINKAYKNPISNNLINLYPLIELPTEDEIIERGKKLVKEKYKTKKGKLIATLNKKKKETIKNFENKSFIEEAIYRFNYLTSKGFIIPVTGSYESGGRVVDSFNLMNSWIREMIKIEGENIATLDYKAFHPNLAIRIYGGNTKFITHQEVAGFLNRDVKEVKIEHLSFFNKHPNDMKKSILFEYYSKIEPEMLERILEDKKRFGYKITSIKMFEAEVRIMQNCIRKLNNDNIYVGYVYDALFCKKSQADQVLKVMNEVLIQQEVYTIASNE